MTRRSTRMYEIGDVVAIVQSYERVYSEMGLETMDMLVQNLKWGAGWNNKMFVRADLMPHHIRITDVRCERLQDISDEDCLHEGIIAEFVPYEDGRPGYDYTYDYDYNCYFNTPREAFADLIDKVSGFGTWKRNPIVWVYEFELVD